MSRMTNREILEKMMEKMDSMESKMDKFESRLEKLEKASSKPSRKQSAPKEEKEKKEEKGKEEKKPQFSTRREAIDAWCKERGITEEDRKNYGQQKAAEKKLQKEAYEMTNSQFTQKVAYSVWRAQYEANLKALKAGVVAK